MTQKELLYIEDAIGHEKSIISICNIMIKSLKDNNLINYLKKEVRKHSTMVELLLQTLEDKSNEWSNINGKLFIDT